MLKGCDVSGWQVDTVTRDKLLNYDFVIIKATEGKDYVSDGMTTMYARYTGNSFSTPSDKCYGFYHYARPDLNNPVEEADFFVASIKQHVGYCLMVLDYEKATNKGGVNWAYEWLSRVYHLTGVKPLLYVNQNELRSKDYSKISNDDYGLWIAHYGKNNGSVSSSPESCCWSFYALHQYTSVPFDKDLFFGSRDGWHKYCGNKETQIKVGDTVKVTTRTDYNGVTNASWVLDEKFDVIQRNGNRVVIGKGNAVTGAWNVDDLKKV